MKNLFLNILFLFASVAVVAQTSNTLSIPNISTPLGQAQIPVAISNSDEIVAVQFDLALPTSISAGEAVALTNRADGHTATARNMGNGIYRVVLFAQPTKPLLGQSGTVMNIPITIPNNYEEGSVHELAITNAILTDKTGANVLTQAIAGSITISKLPDLTVKSITTDKTTFTPGDHITVSWQVENVGGIATSGGWSEQVSFIDEDGTSKLIATTYYDQSLSAKATISRQTEIALPKLIGIHGNVRLQIRVVPNANTGESASAQGNNIQIGNSTMYINKVLTLELSKTIMEEGSDNRLMVKLNRSGSWSLAETFNLTTPTESRLVIPSSVTIPAGQSGSLFYIELKDDDVLQDNDSTIVELSVNGNGYEKATRRLTIVDNELPTLSISVSKSDITEGETFQLTITASRPSSNPIVVTLNSETAKRFSFPSTVTIPAGETSVTVDVTAVENEIPSTDLTNAFTASASRYQSAQVLVILHDNDLPVLELTLTPNKISESAGVVSIAGVLKRTTNKNSKITVKLSDDANGGLYFGNRTLELAKGVEEVHFNFGPVDNAEVDGDRTYTITAAVWLSSCSCSAAGESAGSVTAQLQVFDDDGPALQLMSLLSTIKEGNKTTLTITRNTAPDNDLTVTLSSNYDENLSYNHTVVIPADQKSVEVEVTSAKNDVSGDTHTVVFTVQAEGYSKGTCYMMVTDQTLPDARISSIFTDITETEVGNKATLTLEIINDGVAVLPAEIPIKIYRRGDADAVGTIYTSEAIPVGGSQTFKKTITLPTSIGIHNFYAVINESNKVQELSYNNNISADVAIVTVAPFSIAVNTDKSVYKQGDKILITGQLTGNRITETDIDIYLFNEGTRQVQTVKTDTQGAFSYEWQLYAQQSGHFAVGACYPGDNSKEEMAAFEVYGLKRTENGYITCEVLVGETYYGEIGIENPCNLTQEDVRVELLSEIPDCNVTFESIGTIEGGKRTVLKYQINGLTASTGDDWNQIKTRLVSSSGASMPLTLYYYCRMPKAQLDAGNSRIETTIVQGSSREYPLTITNRGAGESGLITLALPPFMSILSSQPIPSLLPNESTTIFLQLSCTDKMQLNVPVSDYIGLNCENGNGVALPYTIVPVSEVNGELLVDVCDEYTYYTEEKPHVKGATVKIQRPLSKEVLYEGITGDDGTFLFNLPEGYYSLFVSANNHESYERNILIDPERRNNIIVNLSYEGGVSVDWSVVETEIEDKYTISTTITYETNVPVPILDLDIPNSIPANELGIGESLIFYATLTNRGLITIHEAQIILPENSPGLIFESLQDIPVDLSAQQSIVIPVKVTRIDFDTYANRRANDESDKNKRLHCAEVIIPTGYWDCGVDKKWYRRGGKGLNLGTACTSVELGDLSDRSELPLLGRLSGANFNPYIPNIPEIFPPINLNYDGCEPCLQSKIIALAKCGIGFIPVIGCISGFRDCVKGLFQHSINVKRITNCLLSTAGCYVKDATYRKIINIVQCLINLNESCHLGEERKTSLRKASGSYNEPDNITFLRQVAGVALKEVNGFTDVMLEYFGDSVWVENATMEEQFYILTGLAMNTNEYFTVEELRKYKPDEITESQFVNFVERMNNSARYEQTGEGDYNRIHQEIINKALNAMDDAENEAVEMGYSCVDEMFQTVLEESYKKMTEQNNSVCASITLQIDQTMTMTRPAYRGTLTVYNGQEDTAMTDVRLNLVVKDEDGNIATSHEFQINAETLEGFEGELALPGKWILDAKQTGKATILFIPTKYAALSTDKVYSFGGTLAYIDPYTGLEVTRNLIPVSLTVRPLPDLELTYFMQRDVYGDDPLTTDVVEPMQPAEFALIINNKGNGDANNVRMLTEQPKIIDNEKGLFIDFNIKSSQVNGEAANLSFGKTVANSVGTIPAHSQAYAQWWLESSLLGHFTSYNVEATHITSYGNEDLSLLDTVTIHEMIHGFTLKRQERNDLRGFLVNDITDAEDMPDQVYFTDATQQDVAVTKDLGISKQNDTEYLLTVNASQSGWNYGSQLDPTNGRQKLVSVVRQSDGQILPIDNIWQTDRTLRDGSDWLYENRLHFVGEITGGSENYLLTFEPKPDLELAVESYDGLPEENEVLKKQLTELTVKFNKPIAGNTFTTDDITLNCQGEHRDVMKIGITKVSDSEYRLALNEVTLADGYYVLTVQTTGIEDNEGFNGSTGKQATWIQFVDGKVALKVTASPVEGGSVTPDSGRFDYDSTIELKATPAEGYDFISWTEGDVIISSDEELTYHLFSDIELKANFAIKHYSVTIGYDPIQGYIEGAATGIYDHGTELHLVAVPANGYEFDAWMIDSERDKQDNPYVLVVNRHMVVSALFKEETTDVHHIGSDDLQIFISPLPLREIMYITGNFNEVRNLSIYDMHGIKAFAVSNVKSDQDIYVGSLNPGIYFIRIATDKGIYRAKVVKR